MTLYPSADPAQPMEMTYAPEKSNRESESTAAVLSAAFTLPMPVIYRATPSFTYSLPPSKPAAIS